MIVEVGLLGCGTVGSGVVELMNRRQSKIADMTGLRPVIKKILVRQVDKPRPVELAPGLVTDKPAEVLEDPSIRIVIETIGGIEPARTYILQAIAAGKHVVTANKDLIAMHGAEILDAAERHGVDVFYEAAVGGAIPLIRPLTEQMTANEISDLLGIINGTTNYILTQMTETGADFADALAEAQRLGYAEADPSSDVDGLDAARKLAILASIAFHARVTLDDVQVAGIRSISAQDVRFADELGCVIKLLATGSDRAGVLSLHVRPALVSKQHPLAHVSGPFNALFVRGDAAGDLMFFGRGAGSLPTASSVMGDVIEVLRVIRLGVSGRVSRMYVPDKRVDPLHRAPARHYLRLTAADKPGVFAAIASIFGVHNVSMETVLQKRGQGNAADIVIVTHATEPAPLANVVRGLRALPQVEAVHNVMPVVEAPE
ncbi:homoserine dehydrogenase [Alicyclobacillus macrosporangiidus]|uniref:homoserine dehydrogenase n=1 Tax=Alicyclobacillus macrosporangiidus TaxID=392015 RepID=UPI0004982471|nr:homoserine dehydrogenase [Alicyclobacillus macrosporangiidus]